MTTEQATASSGRALSEAESKKLLADYGVPVVEEGTARTVEEARLAAEALGFPVVLKACGEGLTHKTELGLVCLGLADPGAVIRAAEEIEARLPDGVTAEFLVQRQIQGRREFLVGLTRDLQFGPCVSFGLGGVMTEALEDVSFRVAPLQTVDAEEMIDDIRASKLLGPFRGEPAVDREILVATLLGLSRLGLERDDVQEVDLNPLVVDSATGRPVAVDALVVLGE